MLMLAYGYPAGKTSIDQPQNQHQNTTYAGLAGDTLCT